MQFFVPMVPPTATHQEKKISFERRRVYEPAAVKDARAKLSAHLAAHRPPAPFQGPLRCMVKWCFPLIKGKTPGQWKDTRPDTHNLDKLLFDVMTDLGFWRDDAQVASEIIEKFWAEPSGLFIQIEELR